MNSVHWDIRRNNDKGKKGEYNYIYSKVRQVWSYKKIANLVQRATEHKTEEQDLLLFLWAAVRKRPKHCDLLSGNKKKQMGDTIHNKKRKSKKPRSVEVLNAQSGKGKETLREGCRMGFKLMELLWVKNAKEIDQGHIGDKAGTL